MFIFDLVYWGYNLFVPLLLLLIAQVAFVGGLLWSPIGAWICWRTARSKGFQPWRYAIWGAIYSVCFFLPWVYLLLRMHGRSVSVSGVKTVYKFLYGIWLFGPIPSLLIPPITWLQVTYSDTLWSSAERIAEIRELRFLHFAMLITSILMFVGSLVMIAVAANRSKQKIVDPSESTREVLPDIAYILPFALLEFWFSIPALILVEDRVYDVLELGFLRDVAALIFSLF